MKRFSTPPFALAAVTAASLACAPVMTRAADAPLALTVDGRPVSRSATVAIVHRNVPYVNVVEIVRTFNGLVSLHGDSVTVTVRGREATFRANDLRATVGGTSVAMPGRALLIEREFYVPLAFFVAQMAPSATLRVDRTAMRAMLHVPPPAAESAAPAATP